MTVLQRPSKGMNSKCGRNRTVRGEQDDATLEDHRASREAIGKIIKTTQTFPMTLWSTFHVQMDPITAIGLLASIENLAQGAFKIVSYLNTIREGGKQRLRLFTELNSLWMVLKLVESHFDPEEGEVGEPWLKTIAVLDEENGVFDQIQATFDELMNRLQPKTGHRKVAQTLRWPFDKSDVEALTAHLERLKSSVNLALNSMNAAVSREIQNDTKLLKLSVAEDKVKAIIDWISSLNFLKQQDDFINQAREGTGEWFLERKDFLTWASKDEAMLWCPGIPGAGKTFLASIAVEYMKKTFKWQNAAVLVIYCGYNDAKSQSINNLIASLIKQVLQLRSDVSPELHELYNTHSRTGVFPSLEILTGILRTEVAKFDKCFIVVDALDEILDESKRLLLLETLTHGKVNIMVTSRPLDSIRDLFGLITDISCDGCEEENLRFIYHCKQCLSLSFDLCEACRGQDKTCPQEGHYVVKRFGAYQVEIEATESDVRNYVQWRIDHEAKLLDSVNKKKALREEIAGTIVQQANGMFLLARLHMDSLANKRTPRAVHEALQNLPTKIGDTYDQAMQRIEATNDDDRRIVMNFLLWIAFSIRPLSVAEVEHATSITRKASDIDPDEVLSASDLTSMCAGLVIVDASDIVRLVHFSAQSYFKENRERWFSHGDLSLARDCLTYLSFKAFEAGPCSGPTESEDFKRRSVQYPLLEYSCSGWGVHASRTHSQDDLTDQALGFLNSQPHLDSAVQALWYSDSPIVADWDVKSGIHPLHLAAYCGLANVVSKLLKSGVAVDCRDSLETTPLMHATSGGHTSIVQILLRAGANPNLVCGRSSSSLHRAIANNDINVARLLLDQPNIDLGLIDTSRSDTTPLMLAASLRRTQILPIILHKPGLDVNARLPGPSKSTALTIAASTGDPQVVRQILSHPDIDVDKKNHWCTPLTEAAQSGSLSVVEALLDHGADPEIQEGPDSKSGTPLNRAIDYGYAAVVRLLLERGANPRVLDAYDRTIIHSAGVNGQDEILRILFEKPTGVDINAQGNNGRTVLHDAAYFNRCSTIKLLFEHGARTDIHDNAGRSPLGVAKDMNNLAALTLLTNLRKQESARDESEGRRLRHVETSVNGADEFLTAAKLGMTETVQSYILLAQTDPTVDLNMADLDLHSALHYAVQLDHIDVLGHLVLAESIDLNIRDRLERTPLHWTALYDNYAAAELLLDAGAKVDLEDHFKETPLIISLYRTSSYRLAALLLQHGAWPTNKWLQVALCAAAQWGTGDLVKKLIAGGADPRKKDIHGQTPYHLAEYGENEETAKMILLLCEEHERDRKGSAEDVGIELVHR